MEPSEYLELVTLQIRCKSARGFIAEELLAHIEDQAEGYREAGMTPEEAMAKAVKEMGDPVETGTALDRIHRPKLDWQTIAAIGALAGISIFLQYLLLGGSVTVGADGEVLGYPFIRFSMDTILGFLVMVSICMFGDYTFLGKRPLLTWLGVIMIIVLWSKEGTESVTPFVLLAIPVFSGIVYHYRDRKYKGIAAVCIWLVVTSIILLRFIPGGVAEAVLIFITGSMILSFAIGKGWYEIPKRAVVFLWGAICLLGVSAVTCMMYWGADYQSARIKVWLHPGEDVNGSGYVIFRIREILEQISFAGGNARIEGLPAKMESSFFFLWLINRFGSIAGILLIAALSILFIRMLGKMTRQTNRLGTLVGIGSILGLFVPALLHILTNLALLPYIDQNLPVFSAGGPFIIAYYGLIGLYLSANRRSGIVKCEEVS